MVLVPPVGGLFGTLSIGVQYGSSVFLGCHHIWLSNFRVEIQKSSVTTLFDTDDYQNRKWEILFGGKYYLAGKICIISGYNIARYHIPVVFA